MLPLARPLLGDDFKAQLFYTSSVICKMFLVKKFLEIVQYCQ